MSQDNNEKILENNQPEVPRLIKEDATQINMADAFTTDGDGNLCIRAISSN